MNYGKSQIDNPEFQEAQIKLTEYFKNCMANMREYQERVAFEVLTKGSTMSANDKQVGGDHYQRDGEQHWDRMWRLYGRGYFVGCITKYVERYHLKNGIQDLEKAIHFTEKLIELEGKASKASTISKEQHELFKKAAKEIEHDSQYDPTSKGYVNQDL